VPDRPVSASLPARTSSNIGAFRHLCRQKKTIGASWSCPHLIAEQLGHCDGGTLVKHLYGHPDALRSRRKIGETYRRCGAIKRAMGEDGA
jgi:hypothetical protein